jgi:hypothetical protein
MSRDDWLRTGGYAEVAGRGRHLDGLLVHQAHWLGIAQRLLPFAVYHLEHEGGWVEAVRQPEPTAAGDDVPRVTYAQYREWLREMRARRGPLRLNDDDWGFANVELPETVVA